MTDYFSHDVEAADDIKIMRLQMEMKGQGYAIWWRLLELLWKNDCKMDYDADLLAYNIRWCTSDEVRQVVENYGLFTIRDGQFWNESQLDRWAEKKAISEARASAARQGAEGRRAQRQAAEQQPAEAPAEQVPSKCSADAEQVPSNKLINKLINKSLSLSAGAPALERDERERIFVKFLFKNIKDPAREVGRYWSNYAGLGWKTAKGSPIEDRVAYADGWRPEQSGRNFDATALRWLQNAYERALAAGWEYADTIPLALVDVAIPDSRSPRAVTVVFSDKEAAVLIKQYIIENNLADGWEVTWQIGTKRISK